MSEDGLQLSSSSFAERFGLRAMTPYNSFSISTSLDRLRDQTQLNWALVILAVAGKYLPEQSILDYALQVLDEHSDEIVEQLALLRFEANPDRSRLDSLISKLIKKIPLPKWEYGFEQLFYIAVDWLYLQWEELDDPALSLYDLDDDFYYIERGSVFNYHNSWPEGARTRQELCDCMYERVIRFLQEEKQRLDTFHFDNPNDLRSLDDVYDCWERFSSYDLPHFIQVEHESHGDGEVRTVSLGRS